VTSVTSVVESLDGLSRSVASPLLPFRPFGRLLRLVVAIALTAYVLWRARPGAVADALKRTDLQWIFIAIALVVVDRALMAYRAIVLLCTVDPSKRPRVPAILRVFFLSSFAGTFLPASIGGDAVRAYGLSQLEVPAATAIASVLMDRLLGVVSILLMGAVGLTLAGTIDVATTRAIVFPLVTAGALSLLAGSIVFSERAAAMADRLSRLLPFDSVRRLGAELTRATRAYGRYHAELANVLAGSVGVQILRIVQAYCLGRAVGIDRSIEVYFALIPLILLIMLLPVSINGIGPSQVAFVWFFGRTGVPQAQAFALSVLFVALGIVGNLPGGFLYAAGQGSGTKRASA
jgi:uncharacterized protein (TIRG00374 family)